MSKYEKTALRTHYCGEVTETNLNEQVMLCGWVHRRRDLGGLIFIDLRDRAGILQVVVDPEENALFKVAETIRHEFVLQVTGTVRARPDGMKNDKMKTGAVELAVNDIVILNSSEALPFSIDNYVPVGEETRLKYRYVDLRRPEMFERFYLRSKISTTIREYFTDQKFLEVETPMMTKATPEGARDYVVPSRVHPGHFYALPQSPQLFKQLLMMGGFDRYFQLARCMRDEDFRADRQMEFTQLDMEMSFVEEQDVQAAIEGMMHAVFKVVFDMTLPAFPHMTYAEAMQRFGSDKPDLRNPLEFVDVADLLKTIDFKVFSSVANDPEGRIAVLCVPNGAALSRKQVDEYVDFVKPYGAKGLATIKVNDPAAGLNGIQSSIAKFLDEATARALLERTQAKAGDMLFFGADKRKIVNDSLGALRNKLGADFNLLKEGWEFLWVTDFPMFEFVDGRWYSLHHPFTAPQTNDVNAIKANPGETLSHAYDLVLNGIELGSGSIRINNLAMQRRIFELLGIGDEEAEEKFGFLLEAMRYGCPPHGGMALGLDRIVMLLTGVDSIRDVIAFPKTAKAQCLLTNAPSRISKEQLEELHLDIKGTSIN